MKFSIRLGGIGNSIGAGFLTGGLVLAGLLIVLGQTVSAQTPYQLSDAAMQNANSQIQALMAAKAQRTAIQRKLDCQLIFAARKEATGIVHSAAPKLQPSLKSEKDGRIKVDIKATVTPELLAAIQSAGGTIISSLPAYQTLQAVLPLASLESLATRAEVRFIRPAQKGMRNSVTSEGDTTHQAIQARANFGATGAGIKVGVLSDSIDNGAGALAAAIASGDIDGTNTFILSGQGGTGEAEGLAMCEIVHDLAPRATICFATAEPNDAQMAANILGLAQNGCKVIIDDYCFPDEPPFQDGVIAQAVKTVSDMGVVYFSCARNSGNKDDGTSSTWEGDFVNGGSAGTYGQAFHAFASGTNYNPIGNGGYSFFADLFWSDPLGASTNDYDLYMLDSSANIVYSSDNSQDGSEDPYEHIDDPAQLSYGYSLVVVLYSGTGRFLHLDFGRGRLQISTAGCIRGHNACDAANAFTVAATPAAASEGVGCPTGPYPNPFNALNVVELFSSDGPRRMFYNPDGTPITPGNFSATGGRVLAKPEFTAADGVTTTPPGFAPFFGTSAASPHAGAIAALVLSYNPSLTPAQVRTVLTNSCIGIMASGWDRDAGYGILMADLALQAVPLGVAPGIVVQPASVTTNIGATVSFNVTASGSALLSYYWSRNGAPIAGASTSSYTTNNVQLADSGSQFSCLVSNAYGTTNSLSATLTVVASPAIAVTPASLNFGSIQVGTTSNMTLYVTNTGVGTLAGSASVSAPFSIVSGGSYSLGASQGQAVVVGYSPTVAGTNTASVSFTGGGGASVPIAGGAYVAASPVIAVTPTSLNFGLIQVGTSASQNLYVTNVGGGTLTGTATATSPFSIVSGGSYSLAASQGQQVVVSYSPTAAGTNNAVVSFTGGGGTTAGVTGAAYIVIPPSIYSFTNTGLITVNDALPGDIASAATPYPSSITVAGLSGTVSNVSVTLRNFSHTYPHDVGVLLVGPKGQKIVVMGDSGGYGVANVTYTFNDYAATGLTEYPAGPTPSGTYRPSNCGSGDNTFPAGAPGGPYATVLAVCNGANPNGTWSLYVEDDSNGDSGSIANGWSLSFNLAIPPQPPVITQQPQPQAVIAGWTAAFSVTASNAQSYLWRMNGTNLTDGGRISGSTTPGLTIANTQTNDSGSQLSCLVSNLNGGVSSSNALLTVYPPTAAFLCECTNSNGQFQFTLRGALMSNYIIYKSSDLQSWKQLTTVTTTNGSIPVLDPATGLNQRFYRAKLQ
jgi:subtilisin-like proprotein convertase family protein